MTARNDTLALMQRLNHNAIPANFDDANTLRRASITLSRWGEQECGFDGGRGSYAIERDETTNVPHMCFYPHSGSQMIRRRIADKEAGALRRVAAVCKAIGAHYFHQTDPRGCALYVAAEVLTDTNYTRGVAVCS
jgi:hypothetical protein